MTKKKKIMLSFLIVSGLVFIIMAPNFHKGLLGYNLTAAGILITDIVLFFKII